jgi:uncharacterized membrane protein
MDKSVGIVVGVGLALWLAYLVIFLLTRACLKSHNKPKGGPG